jgi:predicted HTH transcriptional regulator
VFLRGNLDLRREAFALAFHREQVMGRWQAVVADAGDAKAVKAAAVEGAKAKREGAKRAELALVNEQRRQRALSLVQQHGNVTGRSLAAALECSPRTADQVLLGLESSQVLVRAGKRGYVFADPEKEAP